jgi:serine/threonine protein kinase/formylglycine-generating enzyme required for sulfatase activity
MTPMDSPDDELTRPAKGSDPFEQSTVIYGHNDEGLRTLKQLAHFRIVDLLGRGGQGEVYRADDLKLQRRVALKVISPAALAMNEASAPMMRARFEREAEVAARLNHPGICPVYEYGVDDGIPWMSMRLIEGEALDRAIKASVETTGVHPAQVRLSSPVAGSESEETEVLPRSGRTSASSPRDEIRRIVSVIESAARALHVAHEAGLVHRDIKPGNLVVTPSGQAVILDFGLARDDSGDGPTLTREGEVMGTPAYMAPEQVEPGLHPLDHRCDVYALGATLFECLALRRPFLAPTRDALARAILNQDAPDLTRLNPAVSRDLAVVVACALEKNPGRRYVSAQAFADDLRRVLRREPIEARPVGRLTRSWRWAQRNPAVAGLLSLVLILLASAAVLGQLQNRRLEDSNRDLDQARGRAERAADAARQEAAARTAALAEYERMADIRRLADAESEAAELWPVHPRLLGALESWQQRFSPLVERLPQHRAALAALRAAALPYTEADRARDHADEIALAARLEQAKSAVKPEYRARVNERIARLRAKIAERKTWNLGDDTQAQFRHDALAKLVRDLERFTNDENGTVASIARRRELAERIGPETLESPAAAWREAIARVASHAKYEGVELNPQVGLIPLGADPASGLEEFLHWESHVGPHPERNEAGRFEVTPDTGLIFVLIPGGSFLMGTQRNDPDAPRYDPKSRGVEDPVHEVTLDPWFMSKYEVTQAQWMRLTGENPSAYFTGYKIKSQDGRISETHPVEQISWEDCRLHLRRWGLELPTEARWERAALAGGDTIYTGTSEGRELGRFANLPGQEGRGVLANALPDVRDDWVTHAPVGRHEPNAYGLFDTTGNVWEWCLDPFGSYEVEPRPGDGLRASIIDNCSYRGGSFSNGLHDQRIGLRTEVKTDLRFSALGVRPVRDLQ